MSRTSMCRMMKQGSGDRNTAKPGLLMAGFEEWAWQAASMVSCDIIQVFISSWSASRIGASGSRSSGNTTSRPVNAPSGSVSGKWRCNPSAWLSTMSRICARSAARTSSWSAMR